MPEAAAPTTRGIRVPLWAKVLLPLLVLCVALLVGSGTDHDVRPENQLWGFTGRRREFFKQYYDETLKNAYNGHNGWIPLNRKVRQEIEGKENIDRKEIYLLIGNDGTEAEHPGSKLCYGTIEITKPWSIPRGRLAAVFKGYGGGVYAGLSVSRRTAVRDRLAALSHKLRKQPAATAP